MKILDFRVRPRTKYFYRELVPEVIPAFKQYISVFHIEKRLSLTSLEESIQEMHDAGVTEAVIFGGNAEGNAIVFETCKRFPNTYHGLAGIDITEGVGKGLKDLERAYLEYGLGGITISPFLTGIYPTDARYYPLYALSEKLGKVVQLHCSTHYNPAIPMDLGNPKYLDQIACHFPELKLVMSHAGVGFGLEGIAVAQRHPNVFVDFSALRPKYLPKEMIHGINSFLREKAIFGTNYPCVPYGIVDEWKKVIRADVQPLFFHDNAACVLNLHAKVVALGAEQVWQVPEGLTYLPAVRVSAEKAKRFTN